MTGWSRRRYLLSWAMLVVSAGVAACDSPTAAPLSTGGGRALVAVAESASTVAAADTADLFPGCSINNGCPTTGTVTVPETGGNSTIGTFGPQWTAPVTVGGANYGFQIGLVNGSFIGIIWKNGVFQGYWGYCLFPNAQNNWYQTTDPATGKTYLHWENHELDSNRNDTGQVYHYIYDPSTNTLKVYHRDRNGNTKLIYQGPPIKDHGKLPPPDPAGANPYTNENQYTTGVPVPAVPAAPATGTTGPGTATTDTLSSGTFTPRTMSESTSAVRSSVAAPSRHWATGTGAPVAPR